MKSKDSQLTGRKRYRVEHIRGNWRYNEKQLVVLQYEWEGYRPLPEGGSDVKWWADARPEDVMTGLEE